MDSLREDDQSNLFSIANLWHNFKRSFEIDRKTISLSHLDSIYMLGQALSTFNYDIVEFLLRRGTKLNDLPNCDKLFLEVIGKGDGKFVELLIAYGANVGYGMKVRQLEQAIMKKNYSMVEILLKYGADFRLLSFGLIHSFIQDASKYQEEEEEAIQAVRIINIVIQQGFSVNSIDLSGSSVLHHAAAGNNEALVETLLDANAFINSFGEDGLTPLHIAIRESNFEIAEILLDRGADPILIDNHNRMPLHYAVTEDCARLLLNSNNNNNIDNLDREGFTALHYSLMKGKYHVSDLLLEAGANIDADIINKRPPLEDRGSLFHEAMKRRNWDIIRLRLDGSIDVDFFSEGFSPIQIAVKEGLLNVTRLLLEHGADANQIDQNGHQLVHLAFKNHEEEDTLFELITLLLEWKVDVNALDQYGSSPMHYAASSSSDLSSVIRFLLDKGANPELKDQNGRRPIHLASNIENLKCLIDHGVDINAQDDEGRTALHNARNKDIIIILLEAGSDINIAAKDGHLAGHMAISVAIGEDSKIFITLILKLMLKYHAIGIPVCEESLKVLREYQRQSSKELTDSDGTLHLDESFDVTQYEEKLLAEVTFMKNFDVYDSCSLHDLYLTDVPDYKSSKTILDAMDLVDYRNFPEYADMLKRKFKMDKEKFKSFDKSISERSNYLMKRRNLTDSSSLPVKTDFNNNGGFLPYLSHCEVKKILG